MDVRGKAAVVTGASRGIGRATALALAERGCAVAVNYSRSREEAEAVAEQIRSSGSRAFCVQADVADDAACRRMMDTVAAELGRLDVLVNNAAVTEFIPHQELDRVRIEHWDRILGVNLRGPFQCARAARPHMERAGQGAIVNVASTAGITGQGSSIPYSSSKAALITLTVSLARVLAPRIRVNTVAPGFVATEWTRNGLGADFERVSGEHSRRAVLGKHCAPEDVAAAILGIITGSDLVTGQTLVCDGGYLIGPRP